MTSPFKLSAAALALFAGALLAARIGLPEYAHRLHPLGLRGAIGMPWAFAFNLFAFVLPGVLLLWAGQRLRDALGDAGWLARIGSVLVQLSALAFAAQGLLPLDPGDADSHASRMHVMTWMLWWIAFVPGALLLARASGRAALVIALLVLLFALGGGDLLPAPIAQRLAFLLWFGWWLLAARALNRP